MHRVFTAEFQPAARDVSDSSPLLVGNLEHRSRDCLCRYVPRIPHTASVLVFEPGFSSLELSNQHQDSLQQVNWFESANHNRHPEVVHQLFIFSTARDRAHMSRCNETPDAV